MFFFITELAPTGVKVNVVRYGDSLFYEFFVGSSYTPKFMPKRLWLIYISTTFITFVKFAHCRITCRYVN